MVSRLAMLPRAAALTAAFFLALLTAASAQITFPTPNASVNAIGQVQMCLNATGQAVACSSGTPTSVQQAGTMVTGTFSGADTSSQAATLAGTAGKTTYICGFQVNGLGATGATTVTIAIATVIGGNTLNFQYIFPAGAGVASTPVGNNFSPCIPANAANTAITVTVPGAAGNTSTNISAWGFQL